MAEQVGFSFESNKLIGPPKRSNHAYSQTLPTGFGDGSRSLPKSKFSLTLLAPSSTHSLGVDDDPSAGLATPKTTGMSRLKAASTNRHKSNDVFSKRLSIPSFHVADQILMDLLTEQNALKMGTINEDEIDDEDDDNMDIMEFMTDEEEEDDDDDEIDSVMTLSAFPDLPDLQYADSVTKKEKSITQNEEVDDEQEEIDTAALSAQFYSNDHLKEIKINISEFKMDDEEETEENQLGPTGFSGLQQVASLSFHQKIKLKQSYSATSDSNDSVTTPNRSSAADSAIFVAKELLQTELQYQAHLKNLQCILLRPIIQTYFGNDCVASVFYKFLCEIISVSKSFTMRLSIFVEALQFPQLANWIYFSCKRFGVYSHYAKMYDIFLDRLTLSKTIDDNIEFWIKRQEKKYKSKLNNQKLHSLLMMPVQRLPRYILLLEEMQKYIEQIEDGNDVGTILFLELAKSEIQTVSSRVNEMVRQRENRSNLRDLMNRFVGDNKQLLLRTNRVLVYEGFLWKVRKYKIKYYFHLFSDILTYSNVNKNGLFNVHRIIDLHKIAVIDLPNIDENITKKKKKSKKNQKIWHRFLLKSADKTFEVMTENEQEKQNWILLLEAAISRLKDGDHDKAEPNFVKSPTLEVPDDYDEEMSIMRDNEWAPYWIPDDASNKCSCCKTEFSVLNRKHHCRRCGNLVCKMCSRNRAMLVNIDKNKAVRVCNDCHQLIGSQSPDNENGIEINFKQGTIKRNGSYQSNHCHSPSVRSMSSISSFDLYPDLLSPKSKQKNVTPMRILKYIRHYKYKLRLLLEHLCRPIMDVVENNKIIIDFITSHRLYNKSNIKQNTEHTQYKNKKKKEIKQINAKKNKKKEMRKNKKKKTLEKNKKNGLNSSDIKAKSVLNNLYKFQCGHKSLICLCYILEQIYDNLSLLHSELKLIIFKKHVNYEDDMLLDFYDDGDDLNDADHARVGRLFNMYTGHLFALFMPYFLQKCEPNKLDLFNIHIEYASRFPECNHIIIGNNDKNTNPLLSLFRNINRSITGENDKFNLEELLTAPLYFTQHIHEYLVQIDEQIDDQLVNVSDLKVSVQTLKQIQTDLEREKSASQQRLKIYKLEAQFDFNVDLRERGRTLVISDFVTKTTKQNTTNNYYFHLFSNVLCYSSKKLGTNKQFGLRRFIYLSNMYVIDSAIASSTKVSKKTKKKSRRTFTIKYWDKFNFERTQSNNMDAIEEESDDIKTFSLIFDSIEKKKTWFLLLTNLVDEERAKCINTEQQQNNVKDNHVRPSMSLRRYSTKIDGKETRFCGICHSAFNRFFNVQRECIKCSLPICTACSTDNFHLTKTVLAPKHLYLCARCNFHNDNERSCNVTVI